MAANMTAEAVTEESKSGGIRGVWQSFTQKHPGLAEFVLFFIVCNGVTVLQMILMPILKAALGSTGLIDVTFQWGRVGSNLDGSPYYIFDYAAGEVANGGGGGLSYFLAVEITMAIAQVINFITQRNVTFKSTGSIGKAAAWYALAYVVITIVAAALQGLYKVPLYTFCIAHLGEGTGTTIADLLTMLINCAISFWVFFPIMKLIFKQK